MGERIPIVHYEFFSTILLRHIVILLTWYHFWTTGRGFPQQLDSPSKAAVMQSNDAFLVIRPDKPLKEKTVEWPVICDAVTVITHVMTDDRFVHGALLWRHNGRDGVSNHQSYDCLLDRLFRRRSKKTSKLRVTGLCAGNPPVTGEFPAQMASNAENVSIWWRHHVMNEKTML